MALLETKNLHTYFKTRRGTVKAVNGVSYSIEPGKTLGVVGESGSGKSVSAMSILRLLDGNGYIDSGEIFFDGKDLTKVPMSHPWKSDFRNFPGAHDRFEPGVFCGAAAFRAVSHSPGHE